MFTAWRGAAMTPLRSAAIELDLSATMRAEIEHLVDETKQSVGLLRRHL